MKLIPLDTVLDVLTKVSPRSHIPNVISTIMELPTIDPIEEIEKMIEFEKGGNGDNWEGYCTALQELKSRLSLNQK